MRLSSLPVAACIGLSTCQNSTGQNDTGQNDFEGFVQQETAIALNGALDNIGGFNASYILNDTLPGVVVASPSTLNPNYYYTWTRDSALTYLMIIDELILGNTSLQKTVEDYTNAQAFLQTVTNPSGSLYPAGTGLGEPKFYTNLTRYNVSRDIKVWHHTDETLT